MAINFPINPVDGDRFTQSGLSFTYSATIGAWEKTPKILISDEAPANTSNGTLWWNSNDGALYINYNDSNSSQWVVTFPRGSGSTSNSPNSNGVYLTVSSAVLKTGNTMTGDLVMSSANITFLTTSNSGVYWNNTSFIHSPSANVVVLGTSSTEDIRIDSTGNVGIKTSSPAASLDVVGSISDAKANNISQTLTDGVSITWDGSLGRIATVTLGGNRTLANATNLRVGTYILHVIQDSVGSRTLTFSNQYKFTANVQPTLTTAANSRDLFSFVSDGTNMYGAMIPDVRS